MIVSRVYRYRLEPTSQQSKYLLRVGMGCRYIYNLGLQQRNLVRNDKLPNLYELHQQRLLGLQQQKDRSGEEQSLASQLSLGSDLLTRPIKHMVTGQRQSKELTLLRRQIDWMKEIPFSCLQNALVVDLHQAFQRFYRRVRNNERIVRASKNPFGYPVPRRKSHLSILWKPNDISIKSLSKACGGKGYFSQIRMPKCPGLVRMRQDRLIPAEAKVGQKRVIQESDGYWYILFTVEENIDWHPASEETGFAKLNGSTISLQDGTAYPLAGKQNRTLTRVQEISRKIAKKQRQLARKEKFSENWRKQSQHISVLQHKRAEALKSLRHEITNQLASRFRSLIVTDLSEVGSLTSSAEPLLGVADFLKQLSYKMKWRDGELISTKVTELAHGCSQCGEVKTFVQKNLDSFRCNVCGFETPILANVTQTPIQRQAFEE